MNMQVNKSAPAPQGGGGKSTYGAECDLWSAGVILFILLVFSFSLLFLDWYND